MVEQTMIKKHLSTPFVGAGMIDRETYVFPV
jgi:hypothetical protein